MKKLYWLLIQPALTWLAIGFPIVLLAILGIHTFGGTYFEALAGVGTLAAYAVCFTSWTLLSQANWVLQLPLRRRDLPLLATAVTVSLYGAAAVLGALLFLIVTYLETGTLSTLFSYASKTHQDLSHVHASSRPLDSSMELITLIGGFNLFIIAPSLTAFAGVRKGAGALGRPQIGFFGRKGLTPAVFLFVLFLFSVGHSYLECGFGIALALVCILPFLTFLACNRTGIFGRTAQKWKGVALGFAALEMTLLLSLGDTGAENFSFWGPWRAQSQAALIALFESNLSPSDVEQYGAQLTKTYQGSRLLDASPGAQPDFAKVIQSKKGLGATERAFKFFNPRTVKPENLNILFDHLEQFGLGGADPSLAFTANLKPQELATFLHSKNKIALRYALYMARTLPDKTLAPEIWSNISQYSDDTKLIALTTLSFLYGKRLNLDDYFQYKSGLWREPAAVPNVDCGALKNTPIADLGPSDEEKVNFCMRELSKNARDDWSSKMNWIEFPLSAFDRRRLTRTFQSR